MSRALEEELGSRYRSGLRAFLLRLVRDPALAEDLCQETLWRAIAKIRAGELREPEHLSSFLFGLAKNLAANEQRKRRRRGERAVTGDEQALEEGPSDPGRGQESSLIAQEEAERVRALLAKLASERDREVLVRYYLEEEEKESIRRDFGLSSLNFNLVLHRARGRFRALVEQQAPALVALLALVLLPLGWLVGRFSAPREAAPVQAGLSPQADPPALHLAPERAGGAEAAPTRRVRLSGVLEWLVLTAAAPAPQPAGGYQVRLLGPRGELLWSRQALLPGERGELLVLVPSSLLAAGDHRLEIAPGPGGSGVESLAFRVER